MRGRRVAPDQYTTGSSLVACREAFVAKLKEAVEMAQAAIATAQEQ